MGSVSGSVELLVIIIGVNITNTCIFVSSYVLIRKCETPSRQRQQRILLQITLHTLVDRTKL